MSATDAWRKGDAAAAVDAAKARLLDAGVRHDASRPATVHRLWRVGAVAGVGLLAGVLLSSRRRGGGPARGGGVAARLAAAGAPWLVSLLLRR